MGQLKRRGRVTLLNDDGVQTQLHLGPLHDPLLHRVFSNVTEDAHLLLLANPVSSVLMGLKNKCSMVKTIFKTPCLDMKAVKGTNHGLKEDSSPSHTGSPSLLEPS